MQLQGRFFKHRSQVVFPGWEGLPFTLASADVAYTTHTTGSTHFIINSAQVPNELAFVRMGMKKLRLNYLLDATTVPGLQKNDKVIFKITLDRANLKTPPKKGSFH